MDNQKLNSSYWIEILNYEKPELQFKIMYWAKVKYGLNQIYILARLKNFSGFNCSLN